MYLDRIEISGFKSFADKTIIDFNKGVTAVVGPNGSGKSNLSEAIKWVLGEQSAKSLRGKKMDDIIFAGSQTRKPTNVAEVNLILNNEDHFLPLDFEEIQITRRFYRNGDSECLINKKPCRLKDIVNLLMDSGLGKDSFSIISQGKVESIFHNKPEERRGMFEEVAGVLKYKTRKQEAVRKLEKTQEHLDRVEDILFEIEKQIEPLKKQKDKAEIYLQKKNELSAIDIALIVLEIDTLNSQSEVFTKALKQLEQNQLFKQKELASLEQLIDEKRHKLSTLQSNFKHNQEKYVDLVQKVEQQKGVENVLAQQINFSKKDINQQLDTKWQKEKTIEQLQTQLVQYQQDKLTLSQQIKLLQQKEATLKEEQSYLDGNSDEKLEQERQRYIAVLQQQAKINNELVSVNKSIQMICNQENAPENNVDEFDRQVIHITNEMNALTHALNDVTKNISELTAAYEKNKLISSACSQSVQTLEQALQDNSQQLQQKKTRKNTLAELNDDYAGFFQGVKEVLKQKNQLNGIHGALGELIDVPKVYTTAIDTVLSSAIQNIVVSTQHNAVEIINFLKQKRLGRATFLPLDAIKPRYISREILNQVNKFDGFIGVASELVETQAMYKDIVANLLGQTIVVDTIEAGVFIAKQIQNQYRIVSLSGDVIHAGGSLTGGSTKVTQTTSLLSRKQELQDLTTAIRVLSEENASLQNLLGDKKQQLDEVKQVLQKIQQDGAHYRLIEKEKELQIEQVRQEKERILLQKRQWEQRQQQMLTEKQDLDHQKGILEEALDKVSADVETIKSHIAFLSSSQDEKNQQLQQLLPQLQQVTTEIAINKEQQQQLSKRAKELETLLHQERTVLSELMVQQENHLEQDEVLQHKLIQTQEIIEKLSVDKHTLEQVVQAIESDISLLTSELYLDEAREKEYQQDVQKLLREVGIVQTKLAKFDVSIENHLVRLSEEYQLTYEAAKAIEKIDMSIQEAGQKVNVLKREIEQLGNVNLDAVTEYAEITERFEVMSTQQKDLILAKEQLLQTMLNMDEEVIQRFSTTFYAIKKAFESTFPKLFGGGKATLELTDPTNLLETGIDIVAQPPGKKLQNLSLLSGGEKAFTAIALLFAILKVKPVPFCLLDEVEAALDEANVSRYGRYLREFVNDTQFIVITHRKGTMEQADVLYGVTMQESGVSKLASVKFETYDLA